jgi:predicted anti-sigma-YlaC factor YlaD
MNCEQIKGLLSVYLDDQLTVEQRQAIVEHLDICIECHTILEEYRSYDALLAQLPRVGPPPELRDAIFSALGQRKPRTIFSWIFLSLLLLTLLLPLTDSLGLRLLKQKKTRRHPH